MEFANHDLQLLAATGTAQAVPSCVVSLVGCASLSPKVPRSPPRPMLPAVRPATAPVSSVSSKDLPRYRPTSRDGFRGAGQALETVR